MTSRNINLFSLFACGCIVLLFVRNTAATMYYRDDQQQQNNNDTQPRSNESQPTSNSGEMTDEIFKLPETQARTNPNLMPLCRSTIRRIYPKGMTKGERWFTIGQPNILAQGLQVETCSNENSECLFTDGFPSGYKTSCIQKYTYLLLSVMTKNGLEEKSLPIPVACSCQIEYVGNAMEKLGKEIGRSQEHQTTLVNNLKN